MKKENTHDLPEIRRQVISKKQFTEMLRETTRVIPAKESINALMHDDGMSFVFGDVIINIGRAQL